jgi:hypothetical protein
MLRKTVEGLEQLEAIAGIVGTFFVGYLPVVVLLFISLAALTQEPLTTGVPLVLVCVTSVILAVWVTRLVAAALYERYPEFRPRKQSKDDSCSQVSDFDTADSDVWLETDEGNWKPLATADGQLYFPEQTLDGIRLAPLRPVALRVADRVLRVPFLLRPILGLWWLVHFVAAAFIGFTLSRAVIGMLDAPAHVFMLILPMAFQITFLFACNVYLLLAIAVVFRSRPFYEGIWRWRLLIDLATSFLLIALAD